MGIIIKVIIMRASAVIATFFLLFACSQANVVHQQCPIQGARVIQRLAKAQLENVNLRKAAGETLNPQDLGLPRSTDDCDWMSGLTCAEDIGWAVFECATSINIIQCVEDIIGAGHDCWACVCWVVESLLGDGYC